MDAAAVEIFTRQHNVASRPQLVDVLGAKCVDGLVRHGRLVACHRGVYHPAGVELSGRGEAMAALLRCPKDSAVTGPFVLGVLGVAGFSGADAFHVLLPRGCRVRGVHFPCRETPTDAPTRMLGPLRLAAPARALIDCGRPEFGIDDDRLWAGYDSARWQNTISTVRFRRELDASAPRDPGATRWRRLSTDRMLVAESPKERVLDRMLQRFDSVPEPQIYVTPARRVDYFWRRIRLAIEYLGDRDHGHRRARERDAVRDAEIERVGVHTVFVIKEDLHDEPALVAWLLHVAMQRATELGVAPPSLRA